MIEAIERKYEAFTIPPEELLESFTQEFIRSLPKSQNPNKIFEDIAARQRALEEKEDREFDAKLEAAFREIR